MLTPSPFEINNLTITINEKVICKQLNLSLQPGQCLGILGCNGSGKTTLLHSLIRLHPWQSGDVRLANQSIQNWSRRQLARAIGLLLQNTPNQFPHRVIDCLSFGFFAKQSVFRQTTLSPAEQVQLNAIAQTFELTPLLEKPINTLSGGEQRRVELATLFVQDPTIFLLDEPFNQLDIRHRICLLKQIEQLKQQGKRILIASHQLGLIKQCCDRVLLLFQNEKHLLGDSATLLNPFELASLYQCEPHSLQGFLSQQDLF